MFRTKFEQIIINSRFLKCHPKILKNPHLKVTRCEDVAHPSPDEAGLDRLRHRPQYA